MRRFWQTVVYPSVEMDYLKQRLTAIYAELKIGGNLKLTEHLRIDRIDFGQFGNSTRFVSVSATNSTTTTTTTT